MSKVLEIRILIAIDFLMVNLAFSCFYLIRIRSGLFAVPVQPEFFLPALIIYLFWAFLFWFFGLYRSWYAKSRLDELIGLFKTSLLGSAILFFAIWFDDLQTGTDTSFRMLIVIYWLSFIFWVAVGRLVVRAVQKRLLDSGIGLRNALIIGTSESATSLCDMMITYPALGYKVSGFIAVADSESKGNEFEYKGIKTIGCLNNLHEFLERLEIKEILLALDSSEHEQLIDVLKRCEGFDLGIKIIPDLYDIVSGQARISSIYGFPLMDVAPELMKPWEEALKRIFDFGVSSVIIVVGFPIWLLNILFMKLDSRGPIFYIQERVGKNGHMFNIIKFRSMIVDAEIESGPVWANKNDSRVTWWGRIMRKTHLDEIPQFINVLIGDMSIVGPRPERSVFVEKLAQDIPLYKRRLRVKPGITGWAQIKYSYDQSIEDVRTKLKYDLFYIENMSWRFDLTILLYTVYDIIRGKGHT
jgi:exopolysaccharide biosynthesis polyprenyl glycosylphosphotransferase